MQPDDIRAFRKGHRLTQVELADKIGVTAASIRNWESGRYPIPRWLPALLHAMNRPPRRRDPKPDDIMRRFEEATRPMRQTYHASLAEHAQQRAARAAVAPDFDAPAPPPKPVRSSTDDPYRRPLTVAELARVAEVLKRPRPRPGLVSPTFCPICAGQPLESLGLTLLVAPGWMTAAVCCPHGETGTALCLEAPEPA